MGGSGETLWTSAARTPGIDRVIVELETIVERAIESDTRDGYFAALYLTMTRAIKRGIDEGLFEDGPRMDRVGALFAQRYFDAHAAFAAGKPLTRSWRVAFESGRRFRPLILQHLLLGMNAHINLDLGIATVVEAQGAPLAAVRDDFNRVNAVIAQILDRMQDGVAASSPLVTVLDFFAGRSDEKLANFSLEVARDGAFRFAEALARVPSGERPAAIDARDRLVARLGRSIARPGLLLSAATLPFRLTERAAPAEVIRRLL